MNERELDRMLRAIHLERMAYQDTDAVIGHALSAPIEQTPQRRFVLPLLPKWRFQSMFNATKLLVAGAVVALFGGFLLAGVLMQPSADVAPAAASASAAPASPSPTDDAIGVPPYLMTEEVEPGVLKVMAHEFVGTDQGADLVARAFVGVALAANGTPWVLEAQTGYGNPGRFSLFQLGTEERHELEDPGNVTADLAGVRSDLAVADDGSVWARWLGERDILYAFDGGGWTKLQAPEAMAGFALGPDDTVWIEQEVVGQAPHESVHGRVGGTWRSLPPVDEQTLSELLHPWDLDGRTPWMGVASVGPDGEAWVPAPGGLLHHNADGWTFHAPIPLAETADTVLTSGLPASGPDGTVWYLVSEGRREVPKFSIAHHLARLDDSGWTVYSSENGTWDFGRRRWVFEPGDALPRIDSWTGLTVDGDGRLWVYGHPYSVEGEEQCGGVLSFDGREWRQYLRGACVNDLALGADGSVWAAAYGTFQTRDDEEMAGIFVITPEAVAGE